MPLGSTLNSLRLLLSNLDTNKSTSNKMVKKSSPDKPKVFPIGGEIHYLARDIPENHGYTKEYIDSFFNELNSDFSIRENRVLVIKDNVVIGEQYLHPYVKDSWDAVFSASKTLVALALGLLYDEGKVDLDMPVTKILGIDNKVVIGRNKKITLRHLLTMSTGNTFNEVESPSSKRWIKSFFDSNYKFKLGSKFEYNSMNTYIISACVDKIAKRPLYELVKEKIFDPLEISETHLNVSDEGHFKGGWGLHILPEDMAKLGILVKDYGEYNGKRILSKKWIKMMSSVQYYATEFGHRINYGFQMWVDEKNNYCVFNGMYDQDIFIFRNSGVVVVTCCANSEAFHGANHFPILTKYFSSKNMGKFNLCTHKVSRELINRNDLMYYFESIKNKEFDPINKIANSCGVLPLLLQNEVGTYVQGVKNIKFSEKEGIYYLQITEGDKKYKYDFNFDNGVRQVVELFGNKFDINVDAKMFISGKGEIYMIMRFTFLEYASIRYINIKFGKSSDVISVEFSETPGLEFVASIVEVQDENTKNLVNNIIKGMNPALATGRAKNLFSPAFTMVSKNKK